MPKKRYSRERWINAALESLVNHGVEGLKVEVLARNLGVTKGSFYWHFKNRSDLYENMLAHWADNLTMPVLDLASSIADDPVKRIYAVAEDIVGQERAIMDPHIRAWAHFNEHADAAVRKIDKLRFEFIKGLFADVGFDPDQADVRGRLLYYYMLGEHFTTIVEPKDVRLERLRSKIDLLLRD